MLWLIHKNVSYDIISCNLHEEKGMHQLWVTKKNGKNAKIYESKNFDDVVILKEAIDYAIEKGEKALRLE